MKEITIWHNPRCSKSRQTLELLRNQGHEPTIVEYLKTPPSKIEILNTLVKLQISAHDLIRTGEEEYKSLGLSEQSDDKTLVQAMETNPKLIERPVVFANDKAAIGRPPEAVLKIL